VLGAKGGAYRKLRIGRIGLGHGSFRGEEKVMRHGETFEAEGADRSIPPPLTPPHKGEGDSCEQAARDLKHSGKKARQPCPPPPCGEGSGVGVHPRPFANTSASP